MLEIPGYEALPSLPPMPSYVNRREYIRSKSDPRVLIACHDGTCYVRRDGAAWEWPAYQIDRDRDNVGETRKHAFAVCDKERIAPASEEVAA